MGHQGKMEVLEERVLWVHRVIKENQEQEVAMEGQEEWEDLEDREIKVLRGHLDM